MRPLHLTLAAALLLASCTEKRTPEVDVSVERTKSGTAQQSPTVVEREVPVVVQTPPAQQSPSDTAKMNAMQRELEKLKQKVDEKNDAARTGGTTAAGASSSQRVQFSSGRSATTLNAQVNPGATKEYILNARAGQTLIVRADAANNGVRFVVSGPGGASFDGGGGNVQEVLPADGDYVIRVSTTDKGPTAVPFSLYTEIR